QNKLKQIGLALHNYHQLYRRFPAGISAALTTDSASGSGAIDPSVNHRIQEPPTPGTWGSWLTMILPFVEMDNLYKELNLSGREYGYSMGPTSPGATVVPAYVCPADHLPKLTIQYGTYYFGVNSYFANAGTVAWPLANASLNGVMYYNSSVRIDHITD